MQGSPDDKRNGFATWLRTGRWPDRTATPAIERKFNPWHDPEDGRFTFRGTGRHYGSGGQEPESRPTSRSRARPHLRVDVPAVPLRRTTGGGGSFGGAGAGGAYGGQVRAKPEPTPRARPAQLIVAPSPVNPRPSAKPVPSRPMRTPRWRKVERNEYHFFLDEQNDPHRIEVASLSIEAKTPRSRSAQRNAGKPDRLPTDDGGHYIAHRFNGPNDSFNHFPQDAGVNRGKYRALEQKWFNARAKGTPVSLAMNISYPKGSRRPDVIRIWYNIGGDTKYAKIDNRPSVKVKPIKARKRK